MCLGHKLSDILASWKLANNPRLVALAEEAPWNISTENFRRAKKLKVFTNENKCAYQETFLKFLIEIMLYKDYDVSYVSCY